MIIITIIIIMMMMMMMIMIIIIMIRWRMRILHWTTSTTGTTGRNLNWVRNNIKVIGYLEMESQITLFLIIIDSLRKFIKCCASY